ncbi:hypothetical protein ACIOYV_03385 [Pseudomonas sp. NPDC087342]|uniref:hypothetical protein n=1 Tax=Pseudomonas sp. NPDC087342 TaxID=3364437 RepID=UPI00380EE593
MMIPPQSHRMREEESASVQGGISYKTRTMLLAAHINLLLAFLELPLIELAVTHQAQVDALVIGQVSA